jgi:hypothetical protein
MRWTLHGQNCQNGYWLTNRITQDASPAALVSYVSNTVNYFHSAMTSYIKNLLNNQTQIRGYIGTCYHPHNGPIAELVFESMTGDQPDESLPSYCSAILTLRTGFGGKRNRGRIYYGGIGENDTADGRLGPDSFNALTLIGNQLVTVFGPSPGNPFLQLVVFSRRDWTLNGSPNYDAIKPVVQCVPRSVLGTQRHRLIGKGG